MSDNDFRNYRADAIYAFIEAFEDCTRDQDDYTGVTLPVWMIKGAAQAMKYELQVFLQKEEQQNAKKEEQ